MRWAVAGAWLLAGFTALTQAATEEDYKDFVARSKGKGYVDLNSSDFHKLVDQPRDYSVSVLMTSEGHNGACVPCQLISKPYREVAKQFEKQRNGQRHIFAIADVDKAMQVFAELGFTRAPLINYYSANSDKYKTVDLGSVGSSAAEMVKWYNNQGLNMKYRDPQATKKTITAIAGTVAAIVVSFVAWPYVSSIFRSKVVWGILSVGWILVMTAGKMWANIRHPLPFNPRETSFYGRYIQPGYQSEYGTEVYVIAGVYALLGLAMYVLLFIVPLQSSAKQKASVLAWCVFFAYGFHILLQIFNIKQPGYPFKY